MHYNSPTRNNTALNLVEEDERLAAPVHAGCAHDVQAAQLDGRTATDAAAAGTRRGRRQRSAKIEGEASSCVADIFQGWSGGSVPQATVLPRQGRNALIEATDVTERRSYLTAVRKLCVSPTRRRRPACAKCQTKIHSAPFKCRQKYEPTFSKSKVAQVQMTQKIFVHECKSRLPALALLLLALHGCCLSKSAYFCRH